MRPPLLPPRSSALGTLPAAARTLLLIGAAILVASPATASQERRRSGDFVNPIAEGADPWVIRHGDAYYWCQSEGNRGVAVWKADRLTDLGEKHVVWRAPDSGPHSAEIWAPELHFLDGRWYVYVAASNGRNENHRTIVLESASDDPLGEYTLKAELYTGDSIESGEDNRWAIDATVLEVDGKRYFVWSGWEDTRDEQWLYIAPMKNPWTAGGNRVRICDNDDHLWERVGESAEERGLHEAPQVLQRDGRSFVVYSCSGSWEPSYKLGLLELRAGGDPLNPADWSKRPEPVFRATEKTYGVGHCSFTKSPDGREDWMAFHAKVDRRPGWRRAIHVQPFGWSADGEPRFGEPVAAGIPIPVPSGQVCEPITGAFADDFETGLDGWAYYGHQQYFGLAEGGVHLGRQPEVPINQYRCGEKLLVRDGDWDDFTATAKVTVVEGGRDAGLLFRVTGPSIGYDAQRGYFFGLMPGEDRAVLGYTDGGKWQELGRADLPIDPGRDYELSVTAKGADLAASIDGRVVLNARDDRGPSGTVGLRVVDVHARFDDFRVEPLAE